MRERPKNLRAIPAVEKVLQAIGQTGLPRPVVVAVVRRELAALRAGGEVPAPDSVVANIRVTLDALSQSRLQPLINGTGVMIHTNLGRAPLGPAVVDTLSAMAANYNNLEYDLRAGERGGRAGYLEHNLALLCEAQAATVVNNCAAALVLILRHFTAGARKQVIISRGELVQIGGGFRIPEILESSGAVLREIGATNKTALADYSKAIGRESAMILKVHRSNFFMGGFVESPTTEELAALARRKRIPFVEDLGSGAVVQTERLAGVDHEPTPAEVLRRGVDLVCFSGDKLFGGPQAGLIAGRSRLVAALKREPFFRALRCDKLILSALQTTVDLCLENTANKTDGQGLPALEMLAAPNHALRRRAEALVAALAGLPIKAAVGNAQAQVGGGTLPRAELASVSLDLLPEAQAIEAFAARLRRATPPVVGYVGGGKFKLDLRTIFPRQDAELLGVLRACLESSAA
jgi:L-seryl-tRNA(Ser) seleniumtransferase